MSTHKKYLDFETLQIQFNELKMELLIEENEIRKVKTNDSSIQNSKHSYEKNQKDNRKQ